MTMFDQKTLIPADDVESPVLLWTYRADNTVVGMGTMRALRDAFAEALYYGDGEDHNPGRVWVLDGRGPVLAKVVMERAGDMMQVTVLWTYHVPGAPSSKLGKLEAWYPIGDF